ncbi:MAG: type III-B CRISPR module RAMP protein Cmr1, partial [Spirulinaceae cyanobacterium]
PSITFDLETVTPLFLAGADQQKAELRPPAFRGALRYWFRAIAGQYYSNDLEKLRELEASILGDTTEKNGASKIIIRLRNIPSNFCTYEHESSEKTGLNYLWFSLEMNSRKAIDAEIPFSVEFSTRPNPKYRKRQEKNLLIAANCFWLAVNLGGFGSRERRGAGSLRVKRITSQGLDERKLQGLPRFDIKFKAKDIERYFSSQINKVQNNFRILLKCQDEGTIDFNTLPSMEIFNPSFCKVSWLRKSYFSWEQALDEIGKKYSSHREQYPLQKRVIFGLPLKKVDMQSRYPSPLRIKIVRSVNDYYCFLIRTYTDFPVSENIESSSKFDIVDEFVENLENVGQVV